MMEELMTVEQVAKRFQVNIQSIYRWVKNGQLECFRLGKRNIRFTEDQVDKFVARKNGEV